ncbi:MAG: protein kinase [Myxococcales bacterium]|nr:protein kinase [Myxococcales bacterium]
MSASSSDAEAPAHACCPTCKAVFRGAYKRCPQDGALLLETDDDPLVGSVLAERYQIEEVLGDGGLGRVYKARHVRMSRRFAIKVPFGEVGYDRKARARLANEAEAASRLDHPNVIGVVDVGESAAGLFYMAMDLADGPPLAELIDAGPIAIADVLTIFVQLADGLTHAHERGLVHRDLKPDNIVISTRGDGTIQARVIDFGLALVSEDDQPKTRLTTEGMVVGTPCYMAPEQATGEAIDFRTDLFALGIILYELLAGRLPFDGTPNEVARQNLAAPLPPIAERAGHAVDPLYEAVVTWLTRKRKDERPSTTREILTLARHMAAQDRGAAMTALPPWARPTRARGPEPTRPADDTPGELAPRPPRPVPDGPGAIVEVDARSAGGQVHVPTEQVARRQRRLGLIVALLVLALLALVLVVLRPWAGGDGATVASVPIDAATPPAIDAAAPEVDAAVALAVPPIDAGATIAAPPPRPMVDAGVGSAARPKPPVDAGATPPRPPPIDAAPAGPVDDGAGLSLKALYARAATELDQAMSRVGTDATATLRARFDAVPPYADAVRKPDLRAQAESQLRSLLRDLAKLK